VTLFADSRANIFLHKKKGQNDAFKNVGRTHVKKEERRQYSSESLFFLPL
jgi:hypothetical protein